MAVTDTHPLLFHAAGGSRLGPKAAAFFERSVGKRRCTSYQPLDLSPDQIYRADELRFTRDPFDGLIVAAANALGLPLLTRDAAIRESGTVEVLW